MPVTITLPPPGNLFGPGIRADLTTSVFGPFPTGTTWALFATRDSEASQYLSYDSQPLLSNFQSIDAGSPTSWAFIAQRGAVENGANAFLNALVVEPPSTVRDSGQIPITWSNEVGLQTQIPQWRDTTDGGGLTDDQALELSETHASTFPAVSVDSLLLTELTSGPTGEFVGAELPLWVFGVIIRLASVPADLLPGTPDGDYWTPTLAVVRIYRGSDLWVRVPVHTSSKIVPLLGEGLTVAVAAVTTGLWLLNLSIQVTWRPGVTGRVYLMRAP